ncbi:PPC domain-containing protein [Artemisia annua]|uniref:AT-hook motif nuclear-localized protein n=1 Tax=Artemisia annua TaxID=35608 RepID=A0A2U1LE01_ARTAN|nr:PPC domain-containing protein [Artemisia annua]
MEGTEVNLGSGFVSVQPSEVVTGQQERFSGSPQVVTGSGVVSVQPAEVVAGQQQRFSGSPHVVIGQMGVVTPGKKKMGRPRKYGPDGKPLAALSPMPISASIPVSGDYSGWKHTQGKSVSSTKKKQKFDFGTSGERVGYPFGANFTPHMITVNVGEDVNMKIISFAQQGSRGICILTAIGTISNVALHQPNSSGGTLTYEGRFDILSLSGSFMPNDIGGVKSRSGGMSVSLAGPDGRVLGGGLAGMLVAAGPVQVILGSFLLGHDQEHQKPKKSRFENIAAVSPPPIYPEPTKEAYSDEADLNFTPTTSLDEARNMDDENNGSLHESEPRAPHTSHFQVSC